MQSEQQVDLIDMIVDRLVESFVKPLNQLSNEKNYFTHVASLAEIVDWSHDFLWEYSYVFDDWNAFKSSSANIFNADNITAFIVAYGLKRFQLFCDENAGHPDYFFERYLTIEL